MRGDHEPRFLFFAKHAIQDSNIQPWMFLAKVKTHQSMYFFIEVS